MINLPFSRIDRVGQLTIRTRSSMADILTAPISAHGCWNVVRGMGKRLAYRTSSTPAIRMSCGIRTPKLISVCMRLAAVRSFAHIMASICLVRRAVSTNVLSSALPREHKIFRRQAGRDRTAPHGSQKCDLQRFQLSPRGRRKRCVAPLVR